MKKLSLFAPVIALVFAIAGTSTADLHNRGGGLIYDDVLDATFLQDTNYCKTEGSDSDGLMNWADAMAWVEGLIYHDPLRDVFLDDWRLPTALRLDGGYPIDGFASDCEMGHIYYSLGNVAGGPLTKTGPFLHLGEGPAPYNYHYWTSTTYVANSNLAWHFRFSDGLQSQGSLKSNEHHAWAVRDGDVGPVPDIIPVPFDAFPQTCPNELAVGAGWLEACILGTLANNVTDIDVASLRLLGVAPVRSGYEDVGRPHAPFTNRTDQTDCNLLGGDEFEDLTLKFKCRDVVKAIESSQGSKVEDGLVVRLTLTGNLLDDTPITGEDWVIIKKTGEKGKGGGKPDKPPKPPKKTESQEASSLSSEVSGVSTFQQ